jgi:hypothetical protein
MGTTRGPPVLTSAAVMEIRADILVPFPREQVYAAYRDRLADLTEYLPNIRSIKVLKREDREGEVHLVNEWTGGGDIPKVARAVVKESMLRWIDHATWKQATFTVEWRTEVLAFPEAMKSSGVNRYVEVAGGTRLELRGTLTCDAAKVPGVPRFLGKTVGDAVERFFIGSIAENAATVGKGVTRFLETQG